MKRILITVIALFFLCVAPVLFAQDHGEIGAYGEYTRLTHANNANFLGLGGRIGFNIHPNVQLEGEMSYDFERSFVNTSSTSNSFGGNVNVQNSGLRLLNGLFGPKFQVGTGAIRLFGTVKGGFLNFAVNNHGASPGTFTNQISMFGSGDTNGVFYPAGGVEFFAGPIGLRVEAGDLMYIDRGANNNLRITFGPQFRF